MSLPCHHPEKWKGRNTVPDATRGVTKDLTLSCAPVGVFTHTYSSLRMPRSFASLALISTNMSCCNSASHGLERVSSPPPSYSTSRPLVMMSGKFFATSFFRLSCCTDLYKVGRRQNAFLSSCEGYFSTRSARVLNNGSRCSGTPSGKFHTTARAFALPNGM